MPMAIVGAEDKGKLLEKPAGEALTGRRSHAHSPSNCGVTLAEVLLAIQLPPPKKMGIENIPTF